MDHPFPSRRAPNQFGEADSIHFTPSIGAAVVVVVVVIRFGLLTLPPIHHVQIKTG